MTARTTRKPPTPKPVQTRQTLPEVVAEVSAAAPVLGGLRANLEEVAIAAGSFYRRLHRELPSDRADDLFTNWSNSVFDTPPEDAEDPEPV